MLRGSERCFEAGGGFGNGLAFFGWRGVRSAKTAGGAGTRRDPVAVLR